ncbi:hypothetical protein IP68_12570 [Blastomonas sp. AAP25]|uniref:hypothetical protein n=1 Tax=Blastomonas sp. AAP25 TaxID=1523416 RepID=UPI0006B975A3|nr:hypothetical protein [Blastomonas sp. AAP25]KPF74586.1 hypothetical protein IP68_12570 [Blastomonas sp. AAP25]
MDYFKHRDRMEHQRAVEAEGRVADSMDVRIALMERVHAGEITLQQAQSELTRIKRAAKTNGQITRAQAYRGAS